MPPDYAARIAALAREVAGVDERASLQFERALRDEFGGRTIPIAAQPPVRVDLARVDAGLRERLPVDEIARQIGVSRTTIYRHLKARQKVHGGTQSEASSRNGRNHP